MGSSVAFSILTIAHPLRALRLSPILISQDAAVCDVKRIKKITVEQPPPQAVDTKLRNASLRIVRPLPQRRIKNQTHHDASANDFTPIKKKLCVQNEKERKRHFEGKENIRLLAPTIHGVVQKIIKINRSNQVKQ